MNVLFFYFNKQTKSNISMHLKIYIYIHSLLWTCFKLRSNQSCPYCHIPDLSIIDYIQVIDLNICAEEPVGALVLYSALKCILKRILMYLKTTELEVMRHEQSASSVQQPRACSYEIRSKLCCQSYRPERQGHRNWISH